MGNPYFAFKQFTVHQSRSAMKVGTDGVVLGAWCRLQPGRQRILDAGCGTGLIALMLAQRAPEAKIDALDIDENSCADAMTNFDDSPWADRLTLYNTSLQTYSETCELCYDHIVSNPPYFIHSLRSPDGSRTIARHTDTLPYSDLLESSDRLLKPDGLLSVILPPTESAQFLKLAIARGLHLSRKTEIQPKLDAPVKRILLEFSRQPTEPETTSLILATGNQNEHTPDYIALTRDFYLKF